MLPNAVDLEYFIEVASTKNISRASEKLGISQPSLTIAIKRLENSIGSPLLLRSKKGVELTQAGKQLLIYAKQLLYHWEEVKVKTLQSTLEVRGQFRLGAHTSVALYTFGYFLPELLEDYPLIDLTLKHDLSRKITESVISMNLDIGIVVNPVPHPDLVIKKIYDDEVALWVGPGDYKIQNYEEKTAILICDPELIQTQDILNKLKKQNISFARTLTSSNLEVITHLVASGAGVGILPGRVAGQSKVPLKKLKTSPIFKDEICVVYRVENKNLPALKQIVESILDGLT
jgi:DNA-binding transcriptional LysR family regulator